MAHLGPADRPTRLWCLVASLAPDVDGLGLLFGPAAYGRYHHRLTHNLLFGVAVTLLSVRWVGLRALPLGLVFLAFLSHLVGDFFGSGPRWPLWPFLPFSDISLLCACQWDLVSWQNTLITIVAMAVTLGLAIRDGRTPLEFVHAGLERTVVDTLQLRAHPAPCAECPTRASVRCHACDRLLCEGHVATRRRLRPRCADCASALPDPPADPAIDPVSGRR